MWIPLIRWSIIFDVSALFQILLRLSILNVFNCLIAPHRSIWLAIFEISLWILGSRTDSCLRNFARCFKLSLEEWQTSITVKFPLSNFVSLYITKLKICGLSCLLFSFNTTEFDSVWKGCYSDGTESLRSLFGMPGFWVVLFHSLVDRKERKSCICKGWKVRRGWACKVWGLLFL